MQDTPHPQTVDISFLDKTDDVVVSIVDVYPGSKYEDTCMSLCITYPYKVIPYPYRYAFVRAWSGYSWMQKTGVYYAI